MLILTTTAAGGIFFREFEHTTVSSGVAFAAVVVLTMLAAFSFDPRLLWDRQPPSDAPDPARPATPNLAER